MSEYRSIAGEVPGEYEEKKSRFIATIRPVSSEEEAVSFINEMKKKYWDARHNCSAFVIGDRGELTRCSDDGEPSGTAGRPMLEILTNEGLTYVCAVVTRYFGGVLLGTGGLVRAYQAAVKDGLSNAEIVASRECFLCELCSDYTLLQKLKRLFEQEPFILKDIIYEDTVKYSLMIPCDEIERAKEIVTEAVNGKENLEIRGKEYCTVSIH
ncbi:MAG: YigZ family protein [Lachnospiraceae bacterium]|nr:YigZ family protein [Lachnospiraceae bacterium]